MTRTYQMMFDMINAGEFTPEEALAEARELAKYGDIWQDAVELLIGWAWAKKDKIERVARKAYADAMTAEIATARNMWIDAWERNYDSRYGYLQDGKQSTYELQARDHDVLGDEPF